MLVKQNWPHINNCWCWATGLTTFLAPTFVNVWNFPKCFCQEKSDHNISLQNPPPAWHWVKATMGRWPTRFSLIRSPRHFLESHSHSQFFTHLHTTLSPHYCLYTRKAYSHIRAFALRAIPYASNVHSLDSAWLASVRSWLRCHPFSKDFPDLPK